MEKIPFNVLVRSVERLWTLIDENYPEVLIINEKCILLQCLLDVYKEVEIAMSKRKTLKEEKDLKEKLKN